MIYELRIYHATPGRLAALNKRFQNETLKFWEKHAIRQVGFWTVEIGVNSNDLYFMLEWENLADRDKKWSAFSADPDWHKARAQSETEAGGPLTTSIDSYILKPTAYSRMK